MHACIGEGNGNPLQYSCLENPRDRGAWWAAIYGIAQSQTQLKQPSSSSRIPESELEEKLGVEAYSEVAQLYSVWVCVRLGYHT